MSAPLFLSPFGCPSETDKNAPERGFTDSEIHYICLPRNCQWILSKMLVKFCTEKLALKSSVPRERPDFSKWGERGAGRWVFRVPAAGENSGKYSVTKSTVSTCRVRSMESAALSLFYRPPRQKSPAAPDAAGRPSPVIQGSKTGLQTTRSGNGSTASARPDPLPAPSRSRRRPDHTPRSQ